MRIKFLELTSAEATALQAASARLLRDGLAGKLPFVEPPPSPFAAPAIPSIDPLAPAAPGTCFSERLRRELNPSPEPQPHRDQAARPPDRVD